MAIALIDFAKSTNLAVISTKGQANSVAASVFGLDSSLKIDGHKAAFIALGDEIPTQKLIQSLSKIGDVIVQASYTSQLTANASVVFPAANWLEESGHFVNLGGQIQQANAALKAGEDTWSNEAILNALGEKLGSKVQDDQWQKELTQAIAPVKIA